MTQARDPHTATLLNDGTVLIAGGLGGVGGGTESNTAELYTGGLTNTPVSPMNSEHAWHTATLLNDGTVLIAGGLDHTNFPTTSAELYNPTTKTFTALAGLHFARYEHTATLMGDGTVLIVGGLDPNGGIVAGMELYDPVAQGFTYIADSIIPCYLHTATPLGAGTGGRTVLIAGGYTSSGVTATTEKVTPTSPAVVIQGPPMIAARAAHTATKLLGSAISGGISANILFAGGTTSPYALEVYNGVFALLNDGFDPYGQGLQIPRYGHTATLLNNGMVYIAGGHMYPPYPLNGGAANTAELVDPTSPPFLGSTFAGNLTQPRLYHTATKLNDGTILLTGGEDGAGLPLSSEELYTPTTQTPPASIPYSITMGPTFPQLGGVVVGSGIGATQAFTAWDINETIDGQLPPTNGLVWTSSNYAIATIDQTGVATGVSSGTVTISACGASASGGAYVCAYALLTVQ
jgi:hypothetical protein